MKKAEINAMLFAFVIGIVVVGVILLMGYNFLAQSQNNLDKSQVAFLKNTIAQDIIAMQQDFGSIKEKKYSVEQDLYLRFVDVSKRDTILKTQLINIYPLMKDAIKSQTSDNTFIFTEGDIDGFNLKAITVDQYPHFVCFYPLNNEFTMTLESKGTTIDIKKNTIANVTLSNKRQTLLKSPDNMITIEIPADANPTSPYLAIELVEHEDLVSGEKSDVYKVTPSGITFQIPVTMHMRFTHSNSSCPTSLTYYQESASTEERLTTKSYKVDCESSTAFFKIDRFI